MVFDENSESNETGEVVTFYYTDIPKDIVHENLRKGFLIIGVLLDVFLFKRRNETGKRFGFVWFRHVQDKAKVVLTHNKVRFGSYIVRANVD